MLLQAAFSEEESDDEFDQPTQSSKRIKKQANVQFVLNDLYKLFHIAFLISNVLHTQHI